MNTAFGIARVGSIVGAVGVPPDFTVPLQTVIFRNVGLRGGVAPARRYIPELLGDVLAGSINPSLVLDHETSLDDINDAYTAMPERRATKALVRISAGP